MQQKVNSRVIFLTGLGGGSGGLGCLRDAVVDLCSAFELSLARHQSVYCNPRCPSVSLLTRGAGAGGGLGRVRRGRGGDRIRGVDCGVPRGMGG